MRDFALRLLMARAITGDRAQIEVASFQCRDVRADIVFSDRLADVELVDLYAV